MLTHAYIEDLRSRFAAQAPSPREAARIKDTFRPLGELWLRSEVLQAAHRYSESLYADGSPPEDARRFPDVARLPATSRGGCWVVLAASEPDHPLLRDAFLLPLEWRRGEQHSPKLPRGLADEASRVLAMLGIAGVSLHLQPSLEAAGGSLSQLALGYESAWAALAAGAVIFDSGGENYGDVLVSAAWQADGETPELAGRGHLAAVSGVVAKIKAAAAGGARLLFLPGANEVAAQKALSGGGVSGASSVELRFLHSAVVEPREALQPVLDELKSPPTRSGGWDFDARVAYHLSIPLERAEQYYVDELIDDVVDRMRPTMQSDHRLAGIQRVVLVASESRAGASLLVKLFDARDVLILHDGGLRGGEECVDALANVLRSIPRVDGHPRRVEAVRCAAGEGFAAQVRQTVRMWAAGERVFVDATLGHRDFLFALLAAAPEGAVIGYLNTAKANNRFQAGTEQLKIVDWRPAAAWS
jgi:hypothetical protein